MANSGSFQAGQKKAGGRRAGVPNKTTAAVKDMILNALHRAGGEGYLLEQAQAEPKAFLALVGKILPLQVAGDPERPVHFVHQLTPIIAGALEKLKDK